MHENVARTMSSREIAELTQKQHQHVKRDIERMLTDLEEDVSSFGRIYLDSMNRQQTEYLLDREHTDCLLTGYSAAMRMAVIKRWRELEGGRVVGTLPDFSNPAAAARAWAEQFELRQAANQALAIAAPKVEFVDNYVTSTGLKGFRQTAKLLGANESRFREFLIDKKIMYRMGGDKVVTASNAGKASARAKALKKQQELNDRSTTVDDSFQRNGNHIDTDTDTDKNN
nr:hypothetical protein [Tanacetum cinerariifolium]